MDYKVKIRYNTNYPKTSSQKWRVIINDTQYLVDEIEMDCKSYTSQDIVKGDDGQDVEKFHLSCEANSIEFQIDYPNSKNEAQIKVFIK